jgi:hypothetical protein
MEDNSHNIMENLDKTKGEKEVDATEPPKNENNEYIDKLTLELLINKTHYHKYLSKSDPKKYDEYKEYKAKLRKYAVDIIDITSQLIEDPKKMYSNDIEESFHAYVKSIIKYFEIKEFQYTNTHSEYNNEDEVIFTNFDNDQRDSNQSDENTHQMKSYWGKEKVVKKPSSYVHYDMNLFRKKHA